jgi:predicted nucleic acid-binding protein
VAAPRLADPSADKDQRKTPRRFPAVVIAATGLEHGLTVVTRNVADFQRSGVNCLDPFT